MVKIYLWHFAIWREILNQQFEMYPQPSIMLSAHSSSDEHGKSYVCVWNVTQPSAPNKVLVASGGITACCFSPLKASVAIAGLVDGTVCAWDLREAFSFHQEVARSGEGDDQAQY